MTPPDTLTQINPRYPVLWETPETIRVGFDRPLARVRAVSAAAQRLISELIRGARAAELGAHSSRLRDGMLSALAPALVTVPSTPPPLGPAPPASAPPPLRAAPRSPRPVTGHAAPGVRERAGQRGVPAALPAAPGLPEYPARRPAAVATRWNDDGHPVAALRDALGSAGLCEFVRGQRRPELAVEVVRFLEPLGRTSRWLSAGIPVLLVRFGDDAARVGPLVSASGAPCHACETLYLTDADPALPALAAQLYGARPASETTAVAGAVGQAAAHFIRAWQRNESWVHSRQLSFPIAGGELGGLPSLSLIRTHPACGCSVTAARPLPPRTGTVAAPPGPRSQIQKAAARPGLE